MAARSWVPGLSAVVCTENGGPLSPDQFSRRPVTAMASRALLGQVKPESDFSIILSFMRRLSAPAVNLNAPLPLPPASPDRQATHFRARPHAGRAAPV